MTPADVPWRFSRESQIRIDREGRFWHDGDRVLHPGLERALASWVDIDPATERYILRNTLDWCYVTVDDAPLAVRTFKLSGDGAGAVVELSDGTTEPLPRDGLRMTPEGVVYCTVHGGRIPARFDRTAAFTLLERVELTSDGTALLRLGTVCVPVPVIPSEGERLDGRDEGW